VPGLSGKPISLLPCVAHLTSLQGGARNSEKGENSLVRSRAGAKKGRAVNLVGVLVWVVCGTEVIESALDRIPGALWAEVSRKEKRMERSVPRTPHGAWWQADSSKQERNRRESDSPERYSVTYLAKTIIDLLRAKYPQYRQMAIDQQPALRITPTSVVSWGALDAVSSSGRSGFGDSLQP
jgi:hypothetical protein